MRYLGGKTIPLSAATSITDFITKSAQKILQFNPTTKSIDEVATDKTEKQICMVDSEFHMSGVNNSLAFSQKIITIKKGFKILRGLLSDYVDAMKSSILDMSIEITHDSNRFPTFFSLLQELVMKMTQNRGTVKEADFSSIYDQKLLELFQMISSETLRLKSGFINFPDGVCQISGNKNLQCLCPGDEIYHRIDISPSFKQGKILAFNNFIFKNSDYKGEVLKSCFFQSNKDVFLLNEDCCGALHKGSDFAVDMCPSIVVSNFSPVKVDQGILVIDDTFENIQTKCDSSSSRIDKSSDILRLSSCDTDILDQNGLRYSLKQDGNFMVDHVQNVKSEIESGITVKDLILYIICGSLGLILIVLLTLLICCFRRKNGFKCCTTDRNLNDPEIVLPVGQYQIAEMQNLRPAVTMQRVRTARSYK